jgi:hypothetical protein
VGLSHATVAKEKDGLASEVILPQPYSVPASESHQAHVGEDCKVVQCTVRRAQQQVFPIGSTGCTKQLDSSR